MTNAEIGQRIAKRRTDLSLTMDDVAQKVGVAKSTIQRYETGRIKKIKLPVIESIAVALSVNPDWLIGNTEDMTPRRLSSTQLQFSNDNHSPAYTVEETELIRKFRCLDDRGQAAVLNVLNYEYESLPGEKAHTTPKEA